MRLLLLNKEDLDKKAFLFPTLLMDYVLPSLGYTWANIIKLKLGVQLLLLLITLFTIVLFGMAALIAIAVFLADPEHRLRSYQTYGLIPGLLFGGLAIKLLINWSKLFTYLIRGKVSN